MWNKNYERRDYWLYSNILKSLEIDVLGAYLQQTLIEPTPRIDDESGELIKAFRMPIGTADIGRSGREIAVENICVANIVFDILDLSVEKDDSSLIGEDFKKKYEKMKNSISSDLDRIKCNVYRMLRVIRNGSVHNIDGIIDDGINVNISFMGRGNNPHHFLVKISNDAMILLYKLVFLLLDEQFRNKQGNNYTDALVNAYWATISNGLLQYTDDSAESFFLPNNPFEIPFLDRYLIKNHPYTEENGLLTIEPFRFEREDYQFIYQGVPYLIPAEALNNNEIRVEHLSGWQIDDTL